MTLIIYRLNGDELTVIVDSLASGQGVVADAEVRKHWINAKDRFLVTGMGAADLIVPWLDRVENRRYSSLEDVAAGSTHLLEQWQMYSPAMNSGYATLFGFGFMDGISMRLEMSSRNGFAPSWSARVGLAVPRVEQAVLASTPADLTSDDDADYFAIASHVG